MSKTKTFSWSSCWGWWWWRRRCAFSMYSVWPPSRGHSWASLRPWKTALSTDRVRTLASARTRSRPWKFTAARQTNTFSEPSETFHVSDKQQFRPRMSGPDARIVSDGLWSFQGHQPSLSNTQTAAVFPKVGTLTAEARLCRRHRPYFSFLRNPRCRE